MLTRVFIGWCFLFHLSTNALAAYTPPLGIPAPPFGIEEVAGSPTTTNLSATLPAGSVVRLPAGSRSGFTVTAQGTATSPVYLQGADCSMNAPTTITGFVTLQGSYLIVECVDIVGDIQVNLTGDHIVLRSSRVRDYPEGRGSFVRMNGTYGVLYQNEITRNGQTTGTKDSHGIMAGGGSAHNWILGNKIHHNGGDGIQFCHSCIGKGNGPAFVYIGHNEIYSDRENALDFKEFIGPVIVSENFLHHYLETSTSNGEIIRVNDEGDQGAIWIIHNRLEDAVGNCISPANSDASKDGDLHVWGNTFARCRMMAQEANPVPPPDGSAPPAPEPEPDPTPPLPTPIPPPPEPEPLPEPISHIRLTAGTATIAFETDEPTRCEIRYGLTGTELKTTLEPSYRLAHSRILDVPPAQTHQYSIRCRTSAGWLTPTPNRTVTGPTGGP